MSFARMAKWLAPAKLNFACSANYLDHIAELNFTAEQRILLTEIPDAMFRESVRDFMTNQSFRKDYWIRGARKLNPLEQTEALRRQRVMLVWPLADVSLNIKCALGDATLQKKIYGPILEALADHQPKTLGQIEQMVKDKGIAFVQVKEAVLVLSGLGSLSAVQDDALVRKSRKQTDGLNAALCDKARGSDGNSYLASPVTGGGVMVNRFQQLFLLAKSQGKKLPTEWAQFVWQLLVAQGQNIIKDGRTLKTAEEDLAELTAQAQTFADKQLPILTVLGIA
jgi:hypothetical protein